MAMKIDLPRNVPSAEPHDGHTTTAQTQSLNIKAMRVFYAAGRYFLSYAETCKPSLVLSVLNVSLCL